jgi:hypothetical protein
MTSLWIMERKRQVSNSCRVQDATISMRDEYPAQNHVPAMMRAFCGLVKTPSQTVDNSKQKC